MDFRFRMLDFRWRRGSLGRRKLLPSSSIRRWGLRCGRGRRFFGLWAGLGARGLQALQFVLRSGKGTLQAALGLPEAVQRGELIAGVGVFEDVDLNYFHADQLPLGDGHLFDIELLGPGLGAPFGFQIVAKSMEFVGIFARQHDGAGAKSMTEGVHANSRLPLRGLGASRLLRV